MMRRVAYLVLLTGLMAVLRCRPRPTPTSPAENQVYCSGVVSSDPVPHDTYVISGPSPIFSVIFQRPQAGFPQQGGVARA